MIWIKTYANLHLEVCSLFTRVDVNNVCAYFVSFKWHVVSLPLWIIDRIAFGNQNWTSQKPTRNFDFFTDSCFLKIEFYWFTHLKLQRWMTKIDWNQRFHLVTSNLEVLNKSWNDHNQKQININRKSINILLKQHFSAEVWIETISFIFKNFQVFAWRLKIFSRWFSIKTNFSFFSSVFDSCFSQVS